MPRGTSSRRLAFGIAPSPGCASSAGVLSACTCMPVRPRARFDAWVSLGSAAAGVDKTTDEIAIEQPRSNVNAGADDRHDLISKIVELGREFAPRRLGGL